jgi:hypothetical protein
MEMEESEEAEDAESESSDVEEFASRRARTEAGAS